MKAIKFILLLIVSLSFNGCQSQTKNESKNLLSINTPSDSIGHKIKPEIKVYVNKQRDSKGNIIKYDSTYSYFYSVPSGRTTDIENDTIYKQFKSFLNKSYPNFLIPQQERIFNSDSLFKYDFFNDDYFQKRYEMNQRLFENMFKQMDSIKSNYLFKNYPNGQQRKKTI